jgi:hypothetical protein
MFYELLDYENPKNVMKSSYELFLISDKLLLMNFLQKSYTHLTNMF